MSKEQTQNFIKILQEKYNKKIDYQVVLVTGTSGKTTTSHYLNLLFQTYTNLKIGLFSKPHITNITERIRINYKPIDYKDFQDYQYFVDTINKEFSLNLGWFDKLVCIAILYFIDQKVDLAIFEIGIGGLNDSTNALESHLNIITNISLEHTNILGKTIKQIAVQKVGIIKTKSIVTTNVSKGLDVIQKKSKKTLSKLYILKKLVKIKNIHTQFPFYTYQIILKKTLKRLLKNSIKKYQLIDNLFLEFPSFYLVENFTLALISFLIFCKEKNIKLTAIDTPSLQKVINSMDIPLKTQLFNYQNKQIIIDTAKDYASLKKLFNELKKQNIKFDVLLAFSKGKEIKLIKKLLFYLIEKGVKTYLTQHSVKEKKLTPQEIIENLHKISKPEEIEKIKTHIHIIENIKSIDNLLKETQNTLIITGSLYLCSEIYNLLTLKVY